MKLKFYSVTLLLQNFFNTFADIKVLDSPRKKQSNCLTPKKQKKCDPEFFDYRTLLRRAFAVTSTQNHQINILFSIIKLIFYLTSSKYSNK